MIPAQHLFRTRVVPAAIAVQMDGLTLPAKLAFDAVPGTPFRGNQ
jgi:hypothetical protein